jgi:hypothetical protein
MRCKLEVSNPGFALHHRSREVLRVGAA